LKLCSSILESLGTTELLVILVVALVLFGPRKLPEMSRKLGKAVNDFRRAGDDFKRTWEREVAIESVERDAAIDRAMVAERPPRRKRTRRLRRAGTPPRRRRRCPLVTLPKPRSPPCRARTSRAAHTSKLSRPPAEEATGQPSSRKADWL
jgi:TatA/E family protein of Tat protein translocase